MTRAPHWQSGDPGRDRVRDVAGPIVTWSVWGALTVALLLFVRQYSRNIPYMDDFAMVPVMTGAQAVTLRWAWSQHNEHRPLISRLIMAGLSRFVANDFRAPRYVNVLLLSTMAAWMLVLVRRLRGFARLTDVVLPLAILNVAQVESLMIGFAMNLVLTSLLAVALIVVASRAQSRDGRLTALSFGLILLLLPLTGGGGLAMLPPLVVWLAGYVAWGWWSDTRPGLVARAIGMGGIAACFAIVALYLAGFARPAYHPPPPSTWSVAYSTLIYLSLAVYPHPSSYWWPAGVILTALVTATLILLARAAVRSPRERPRALALAAIILSMISVAVTVGFSRSGFGPASILASRYVTLTIPLLCALYVAWLAHGRGRGRAGVHIALLVLIVATLPSTYRFSREYGRAVHVAEQRFERGLKEHVPTAEFLTLTCRGLHPDPTVAHACFGMLKRARIGAFANLEEGRVTSARRDAPLRPLVDPFEGRADSLPRLRAPRP